MKNKRSVTRLIQSRHEDLFLSPGGGHSIASPPEDSLDELSMKLQAFHAEVDAITSAGSESPSRKEDESLPPLPVSARGSRSQTDKKDEGKASYVLPQSYTLVSLGDGGRRTTENNDGSWIPPVLSRDMSAERPRPQAQRPPEIRGGVVAAAPPIPPVSKPQKPAISAPIPPLARPTKAPPALKGVLLSTGAVWNDAKPESSKSPTSRPFTSGETASPVLREDREQPKPSSEPRPRKHGVPKPKPKVNAFMIPQTPSSQSGSNAENVFRTKTKMGGKTEDNVSGMEVGLKGEQGRPMTIESAEVSFVGISLNGSNSGDSHQTGKEDAKQPEGSSAGSPTPARDTVGLFGIGPPPKHLKFTPTSPQMPGASSSAAEEDPLHAASKAGLILAEMKGFETKRRAATSSFDFSSSLAAELKAGGLSMSEGVVDVQVSKTKGGVKGKTGPRGQKIPDFALLELWLDEMLNSDGSQDVTGLGLDLGKSAKKRKAGVPVLASTNGLNGTGLGRAELVRAGISVSMVDRIYRALYVYSVGFCGLVRDVTGKVDRGSDVLVSILRGFNTVMHKLQRSIIHLYFEKDPLHPEPAPEPDSKSRPDTHKSETTRSTGVGEADVLAEADVGHDRLRAEIELIETQTSENKRRMTALTEAAESLERQLLYAQTVGNEERILKQEARAKIVQLEKELVDTRAGHDTVVNKLRSEHDDVVATLNAEIQRAKIEKGHIADDLSTEKRMRLMVIQARDELRARVAELSEDKAALRKEMEDQRTRLGTQYVSFKESVERDIATLKKQLQKQIAENEEIRRLGEQRKREMVELLSRQFDESSTKTQKNLDETQETLTTTRKELEVLREAHTKQTEMLHETEDVLRNVRHALDTAEQRHVAETEKLSANYMAMLESYKKEMADLQLVHEKDLEGKQEELAVQAKEHAFKLATIQFQFEEEQKKERDQVAHLAKMVRDLEKKAITTEAQHRIAVQDAIASYKSRIVELGEKNSKLMAELEEARLAHSELKAAISQAEHRHEETVTTIQETLQDEIVKGGSEARALQDALAKMEKLNKDQEAQFRRELQRVNDLHAQDVNTMLAQAEMLRGEIKLANDVIRELKLDLERRQRHTNNLHTELTETKEALYVMEVKVDAEVRRATLEHEQVTAGLRQEIVELKEENQGLQMAVEHSLLGLSGGAQLGRSLRAGKAGADSLVKELEKQKIEDAEDEVVITSKIQHVQEAAKTTERAEEELFNKMHGLTSELSELLKEEDECSDNGSPVNSPLQREFDSTIEGEDGSAERIVSRAENVPGERGESERRGSSGSRHSEPQVMEDTKGSDEGENGGNRGVETGDGQQAAQGEGDAAVAGGEGDTTLSSADQGANPSKEAAAAAAAAVALSSKNKKEGSASSMLHRGRGDAGSGRDLQSSREESSPAPALPSTATSDRNKAPLLAAPVASFDANSSSPNYSPSFSEDPQVSPSVGGYLEPVEEDGDMTGSVAFHRPNFGMNCASDPFTRALQDTEMFQDTLRTSSRASSSRSDWRKSTINKLKEKLQAMQDAAERYRLMHQQSTEKFDRTLDEMTSRFNQEKRQRFQKQAQVSQLESQIAAIHEELSDAYDMVEQKNTLIMEKGMTIEIMQKDLATATDRIEALRRETNTLVSRQQISGKEIRTLREYNHVLMEDLAKANEYSAEVSMKLRSFQNDAQTYLDKLKTELFEKMRNEDLDRRQSTIPGQPAGSATASPSRSQAPSRVGQQRGRTGNTNTSPSRQASVLQTDSVPKEEKPSPLKSLALFSDDNPAFLDDSLIPSAPLLHSHTRKPVLVYSDVACQFPDRGENYEDLISQQMQHLLRRAERAEENRVQLEKDMMELSERYYNEVVQHPVHMKSGYQNTSRHATSENPAATSQGMEEKAGADAEHGMAAGRDEDQVASTGKRPSESKPESTSAPERHGIVVHRSGIPVHMRSAGIQCDAWVPPSDVPPYISRLLNPGSLPAAWSFVGSHVSEFSYMKPLPVERVAKIIGNIFTRYLTSARTAEEFGFTHPSHPSMKEHSVAAANLSNSLPAPWPVRDRTSAGSGSAESSGSAVHGSHPSTAWHRQKPEMPHYMQPTKAPRGGARRKKADLRGLAQTTVDFFREEYGMLEVSDKNFAEFVLSLRMHENEYIPRLQLYSRFLPLAVVDPLPQSALHFYTLFLSAITTVLGKIPFNMRDAHKVEIPGPQFLEMTRGGTTSNVWFLRELETTSGGSQFFEHKLENDENAAVLGDIRGLSAVPLEAAMTAAAQVLPDVRPSVLSQLRRNLLCGHCVFVKKTPTRAQAEKGVVYHSTASTTRANVDMVTTGVLSLLPPSTGVVNSAAYAAAVAMNDDEDPPTKCTLPPPTNTGKYAMRSGEKLYVDFDSFALHLVELWVYDQQVKSSVARSVRTKGVMATRKGKPLPKSVRFKKNASLSTIVENELWSPVVSQLEHVISHATSTPDPPATSGSAEKVNVRSDSHHISVLRGLGTAITSFNNLIGKTLDLVMRRHGAGLSVELRRKVFESFDSIVSITAKKLKEIPAVGDGAPSAAMMVASAVRGVSGTTNIEDLMDPRVTAGLEAELNTVVSWDKPPRHRGRGHKNRKLASRKPHTADAVVSTPVSTEGSFTGDSEFDSFSGSSSYSGSEGSEASGTESDSEISSDLSESDTESSQSSSRSTHSSARIRFEKKYRLGAWTDSEAGDSDPDVSLAKLKSGAKPGAKNQSQQQPTKSSRLASTSRNTHSARSVGRNVKVSNGPHNGQRRLPHKGGKGKRGTGALAPALANNPLAASATVPPPKPRPHRATNHSSSTGANRSSNAHPGSSRRIAAEMPTAVTENKVPERSSSHIPMAFTEAPETSKKTFRGTSNSAATAGATSRTARAVKLLQTAAVQASNHPNSLPPPQTRKANTAR